MYSFTKEQIENIQSKALNCLGQPMKYKELCEKLDVSYIRQTKLKNNQLRDLGTILEIQSVPIGQKTGYVITKIFETPELPYYDDDEWYAAIKSQICSIFREAHNDRTQWFVRTRLLTELGAVNENYQLLMNPIDKAKLVSFRKRKFDNEEEVCRIIGRILVDRIYDALIKMEKERLIIYTNGYVLFGKIKDIFDPQKERTIQIEAPYSSEKDSEFSYLYALESEAIDDVAETYGCYSRDAEFKNRNRVKGGHFEAFLDCRDKRIQSNEVLEHYKEKYPDLISIEKILDVKFITPVWADHELTIPYKPYAKRIINKTSQQRILTSKDKQLERYKELIDGVVKVFINADTDIDYKELLKSLE